LGIRIWRRKAYVVQGRGERLQKVKPDFMNYDVEQLVSQASDCVVWMKTTDGKLQHLYTGTCAHACLCLWRCPVYLQMLLVWLALTALNTHAVSPATRCTYTKGGNGVWSACDERWSQSMLTRRVRACVFRYFNPPVALQKSYIKQLAEDLGANFGLKKVRVGTKNRGPRARL
jgi:hypothetical protein